MISLQLIKRVCICRTKVDFRKGHNGLYGDAINAGLDPYEGDLVVFIGSRKDRIKILFFDYSGTLLLYKIFFRLRLKDFHFLEKPEATTITFGEVAMLLEGATLIQ